MLPPLLLLFFTLPLSTSIAQRGNRVIPRPFKSSKLESGQCNSWRPGDCDAAVCGGFCEARYLRFHDREIGGDRTLKQCSCFKDRLCSIIGSTGCKSYATINSFAQRIVRQWSLEGDKRLSSLQNPKEDHKRHMQLIFANSLFCCHTSSRPRALPLQRDSSSTMSLTTLVLVLVLRVLS